jgi:hypothetical protein
MTFNGVPDTKVPWMFLEKGIYIDIPASASTNVYSYSLLHHKYLKPTQNQT